MAVALGICTAGEHAGRIQMTILSQAKMVITNLNAEADRFDATCVQAMMAHMSEVVSAEEQQRVKTLLEVKAQESGHPAKPTTWLVTHRKVGRLQRRG